ncbi:hypothetical protein QR680_009443 [Steinernema hermaphroditum]|uniref:C2H2-type domain-containing protein n=1 Tax=Steinernema hermaphroditum TaxID=289476 RepID=A0AA39IMB9_9BILA|nr:hypothetical protein QR680_009443 [Steinernema hermaphroditum]
MNTPRRKQNRPNRAAVSSTSSSPRSRPKTPLEDECSVSSSTPSPRDFALPAGTFLGPFPVRSASEDDPSETTITVRDASGRAFVFAPLGADSAALRQISAAPSASEANATVSAISEDGAVRALQVLVQKPVDALSGLRVLFVDLHPQRFACGLCRNLSYLSMENLKTHQQSFPQPGAATVISDSQFSNAISQLMRTPMFPLPILLPVAYHNQEDPSVVQLIGHPQVFVPVAVHRGPAQFRSAPLILNEAMTQNVEVPSSLPLGNGRFDLKMITVSAEGNVVDKPSRPSPESEGEMPTAKRLRTEEPPDDIVMPLDLSKKGSRPQTSVFEASPKSVPTRPQKKPEGDGAEKPFVCDCGVAFSNRETLLGHQRFYCRNRPGADDAPREPVRKSTSFACPYRPCSFEGSSSTQLQTHVRQQHNAVRAYMCKTCGYKGQSVRGMRSHFKEHELSHNVQNENELILEITKDTAMFTCSLCRNEIPRVFQSKHKCFETTLLS